MAGRIRLRNRSSPALRTAILVSMISIVRFIAPSFSLFGSWEGEFDDIKGLPKGLGPHSVNGLIADNGKLKVAVDHGHLNARYADGPLALQVDDTHAWEANYAEDGTNLKLIGQGADDLYWQASKRKTFLGLGDVEVNMTSGHEYDIQVAPVLPSILGAKLKAVARSAGNGIYGRLDAQRSLSKNADLAYSIENSEGGYDLEDLSHSARLKGGIGDSSFDVQLQKTPQSQGYNVSYAAKLDKLLRGDASAVLGFDNDGIYGSFAKSHDIVKGLRGSYSASGRADSLDDDPEIRHSAKLSHDLGSITLSKVADEPLMANLHSDIRNGGARLQGQMAYSFEEEAPDFNLTASYDLSKALQHLGVEGEVLAGIDDASPDGVYGKIAAKRNLGKGLSLQYVGQGRGNAADHALRLANAMGHAELVKEQDVAPRLRLGYQVEV